MTAFNLELELQRVGATKEQLAERIGVSVRQLSRWEAQIFRINKGLTDLLNIQMINERPSRRQQDF